MASSISSSERNRPLRDADPGLWRALKQNAVFTPSTFAPSDIKCETTMVTMRDGVRLATDVYLPPLNTAPAVVVRTPYDRKSDVLASTMLSLARRGYIGIAQDCRGTGGSEPDAWDYYVREPEDGYDFVEWVTGQPWFDGFIGAFGGSYVGQTQWHMAMHPSMTTIVPQVSGLGVGVNTAHLHMFADAFARTVGKGEDKIDAPLSEIEEIFAEETMATGFFNEPLYAEIPDALRALVPNLDGLSLADAQHRMWEYYCQLSDAARAEFVQKAMGSKNVTIVDIEGITKFFGQEISHDRHTLPHTNLEELTQALTSPSLLLTGWYDWGLNDALETWGLLMHAGQAHVRTNSRIFIGPSAHNMPGYHEGMSESHELRHNYREGTPAHLELLLHWYSAVASGDIAAWAPVTYYLMGANEWRVGDMWPLPGTLMKSLYLGEGGLLSATSPASTASADTYVYDPLDPTPTAGGSIVSYRYSPGSVDVSGVQQRKDVQTYTTATLKSDIDVVGPLQFILYAASSAIDTDFCVRLSDVFPDGRAIQLQSGMLRARYRHADRKPEFLKPGKIYRLEIDLWATANRFAAGHAVRVDISSADFPRFDRNTNLGGEEGEPVSATQHIYHDAAHPSHLLFPCVGHEPIFVEETED